MRMLRWTYGVTRLNGITNEGTRRSFGITNRARKMKENKFRWFGRVERRRAMTEQSKRWSWNKSRGESDQRGKPKKKNGRRSLGKIRWHTVRDRQGLSVKIRSKSPAILRVVRGRRAWSKRNSPEFRPCPNTITLTAESRGLRVFGATTRLQISVDTADLWASIKI